MAHTLIDRKFYDAVTNFEKSEEARDYYYRIMDTVTERDGRPPVFRKHRAGPETLVPDEIPFSGDR